MAAYGIRLRQSDAISSFLTLLRPTIQLLITIFGKHHENS